LVLVVSGPSGVGKTVLCDRLVQSDPSLAHSVSATTRPARQDEIDGRDYTFWSEERFRREVAAGHFLEWAQVHGCLYGTPREAIEDHLAHGRSPVLNVDVQGGRSVKRLMPEAVLVFLFPPTIEALRDRLEKRGTDSAETIAVRLANAIEELRAWVDYDYAVVNDDLETALGRVRVVLEAERARVPRLRARGRLDILPWPC
jgi:guanylate kinase